MKRRLKELDLPTQRSCCCAEPNPHIAYCTGARAECASRVRHAYAPAKCGMPFCSEPALTPCGRLRALCRWMPALSSQGLWLLHSELYRHGARNALSMLSGKGRAFGLRGAQVSRVLAAPAAQRALHIRRMHAAARRPSGSGEAARYQIVRLTSRTHRRQPAKPC